MVVLFHNDLYFLWISGSSWWNHDDTQILKQALRYERWQYFFVPGYGKSFHSQTLPH